MGQVGQFHAGPVGLLVFRLSRVDTLVAVGVPVGAHGVVDDDGVGRGREVNSEVIVRDSALSLHVGEWQGRYKGEG